MARIFWIERTVYGVVVIRDDLGRTSARKANRLARNWMAGLKAPQRSGCVVRVLARRLGWPSEEERVVTAFRFDSSKPGKIVNA